MVKQIGIGMLAGLAGTAALTAVVQLERKVLPFGQKHNAMFQHKVIRKAENFFGISGRISNSSEAAAVHASSFAYGTLMGSLYGWWASKVEASPWVTGPAYGLFLGGSDWPDGFPHSAFSGFPGRNRRSRRSFRLFHILFTASPPPPSFGLRKSRESRREKNA